MLKNVYQLYQENEGKELSDSFLEDILEELMEEDLVSYVKEFKIDDEKENALGNYSFENRTLTIHRKAIKGWKEFKLSPTLQAIETTKHGLEYARNLKRLEEGRDDITSKVVRYGMMDYAVEKGYETPTMRDIIDPFYLRYIMSENKEQNPADRIARINAWKYMVNLLKNQNRTPELLAARTMLFHSYNRGYEDDVEHLYLEAPTFRFLIDTRMLEEFYRLRKRVREGDYSFDTRLTCGLPISREEHDKKILQKVRLQKKRSRN